MLTIRKANPSDAKVLRDLYDNHLTSRPLQSAEEPPCIEAWEEKLAEFNASPRYHLLVGEVNDQIVSSVTLIVVENLTRSLRPYAVIENVVTHSDHRGKGYAQILMNRASAIATKSNCYKIMLMTGSKENSALSFYESCGFNKDDKTAFIKWL